MWNACPYNETKTRTGEGIIFVSCSSRIADGNEWLNAAARTEEMNSTTKSGLIENVEWSTFKADYQMKGGVKVRRKRSKKYTKTTSTSHFGYESRFCFLLDS